MSAGAGLEKVVEEVTNLQAKISEAVDTQKAEIKRLGSSTEETGKKLADLDAKYVTTVAELQGQVKDLLERMGNWEKKSGRPGLVTPGMPEFSTISHKLVESSQFKDWKDQGCGGKSKPVNLDTMGRYMQYKNQTGFRRLQEMKTISAGSDDLRAFFSTDWLQSIINIPMEAQRVRDLFPTFQTTKSVIYYLREIDPDFNASVVAEGSTKPESNFSFADDHVAVSTIAHWLGLPRQLLDDIPGLRSYLDNRLIEGLKLTEDAEILYGDGTGAHLKGVLTDPDIQTYNWSQGQGASASLGLVADTKIDAIRRAMTLAQLAHYPVSGIVLHPVDWQDIELTKATTGQYIWVNVQVGGSQVLWRVPVVVTTAIQQGTFLLGAFALGAAIWDREEANIRMSDSHANMFIENRVAILCEERLAVTVFRPQSFVLGTFDAPPEPYPS